MIPADLLRKLQAAPVEISLAVLYRRGEIIGTIETRGEAASVTTNTLNLIVEAQERGADAVTFAHNHPAAPATPSADDEITAMQRRDTFEGHDIAVNGNLVIDQHGNVTAY